MRKYSFPDAVPSRGGERISQKQHRPKLRDVLRGRKNSKQTPFLGREWPGNSRTVHLLKQAEGVNCCYGFSGTFLQRLQDLHETTAYKVSSNKELK